jgi:hypothetical protein
MKKIYSICLIALLAGCATTSSQLTTAKESKNRFPASAADICADELGGAKVEFQRQMVVLVLPEHVSTFCNNYSLEQNRWALKHWSEYGYTLYEKAVSDAKALNTPEKRECVELWMSNKINDSPFVLIETAVNSCLKESYSKNSCAIVKLKKTR